MILPSSPHQPPDYDCPFCHIAAGEWQADELVWRGEQTLVFPNLGQHSDRLGHMLVATVAHIPHIYTLDPAIGAELFAAVIATANAVKAAYNPDGVTIRQHNEPAGGQDVWHIHVHVIPRWEGDNWRHPAPVAASLRRAVSARVREHFSPPAS